MARKSAQDRPQDPAGATLRELQERVLQQRRRNPPPGKQGNRLLQPQSRWQRAVRYNWDKNRGRG